MSWDLIGHEWAVQLLQGHINKGSLRHAYLLTGPAGIGKRNLAIHFIQAISCSESGELSSPCLKCSTCQRIGRQEHPDLKIMASTNSLASTDHFFTYAAYMKQKQRMLNLGFQIFELKPVPGDIRKLNPRYELLKGERTEEKVKPGQQLPVDVELPVMGIHAKSFVVDDRIAFVGSHNFDPRSTTYDTQVAVAIWDEEVARALEQDILRDMEAQNSWVVAPKKQTPVISPCLNFCASVSRGMPVLDIWPTRYSSLFELREGMEALPSNHPDFYVHYENVGQFPEVALTSTETYTIIFSALGGFTTPLL